MCNVCFVTLFKVKEVLNLWLNYLFHAKLFIYKSVTKLRIVEAKCCDLVYIFPKGKSVLRYTNVYY